MLKSLDIKNVVLIDQLHLEVDAGMIALTGETGAGKSIILDALGLVMGLRGESGLIGPREDKATVSAQFQIDPNHPILALLQEQEIDLDGANILLKRVLQKDASSRAFINNQSVTVKMLRLVGEQLLEIQGQFEQYGLLDSKTHLNHLDQFAGLKDLKKQTRLAYANWQKQAQALSDLQAEILQAQKEEDYLRHALKELEDLAPEQGEETTILDKKKQQSELKKSSDLLNKLEDSLRGNQGIHTALNRLIKLCEKTGGAQVEALYQSLMNIDSQLGDVEHQIGQYINDLQMGENLESLEDRLYALRNLARKHHTHPDELPEIWQQIDQKLKTLSIGESNLTALKKASETAYQEFFTGAKKLHELRVKAKGDFEKKIMAELAPLKLDKARFDVQIIVSENPQDMNEDGMDRVGFMVAMNIGQSFAPLAKVASGGELSRLLLALNLVLASGQERKTLIFDEIDAGVGGATADAIGERLKRLAQSHQLFVVTHSPQVAARAHHQWQVEKYQEKDLTKTSVRPLLGDERAEEIARMLAGREISDEARLAARRLLA